MTKPGLDLPATSAPLLRLFNHSTMAPLYDELVRQLSLLVARGFKYIVLSTRRFSATVYPNFILLFLYWFSNKYFLNNKVVLGLSYRPKIEDEIKGRHNRRQFN